jgi:hypothetical protein
VGQKKGEKMRARLRERGARSEREGEREREGEGGRDSERQIESERAREEERETGRERARKGETERERERQRERANERKLANTILTNKQIFFFFSYMWRETRHFNVFAITHCYFLEKSYRSFRRGGTLVLKIQ